MEGSSWFSGDQSPSSEEEGNEAAPSGRRTTSSLSGSDRDLQAAVGYGTSVWRCADLFSVTPSEHSRAASIVEADHSADQLIKDHAEGDRHIEDNPSNDQSQKRTDADSAISPSHSQSASPSSHLQGSPSPGDRNTPSIVGNLTTSSPLQMRITSPPQLSQPSPLNSDNLGVRPPSPSTQSRMSSDRDSSGGVSIFAYRQRQPATASHSSETRRHGTSGTTTSSSGGGTGERKVISSGIFIVSKSGPSWVSDRASPSFATFALAGQGPGQQMPVQAQQQGRSSTRPSPESVSMSLHEVGERTLRPGDVSPSIRAFAVDDSGESDDPLPRDVADWLDTQRAEKHAPLFSPGGHTQIITNDPASFALQLLNDDADDSHAAGLPLNLPHRKRVSGPRLPRAGSALESASIRSAKLQQESHSYDAKARARASSESALAKEGNRALGAHIVASVSGHCHHRVSTEEDHPDDEGDAQQENEYSGEEEAEEDEDDGDDYSRIARMGSMSSDGLSRHSGASEVEQEAIVEEEKGSCRRSDLRFGSADHRMLEHDSDDERRFWVGSARSSAPGSPLPRMGGQPDMPRAEIRDTSSSQSDLPTTKVNVISDGHNAHSKSLVLHQISTLARRTRAESHDSGRRSHPTLGHLAPSTLGFVESEPCSRGISTYTRYAGEGISREAHAKQICDRSDEELLAPDGGGRKSVTSSIEEDGDDSGEDPGKVDSHRCSLLMAPAQVQTAKKTAISRGDAVLLLSASPSPRKPAFFASRPNKTYIDACVQTVPSSGEARAQRWGSVSSELEADVVNRIGGRRSKRTDLRIETGVSPTETPPGSGHKMSLSTSRSVAGVCCPKCGNDFIPPPRNIDVATAIDGAKKLAEARVQARAAALAASSSLSLRSAPAHQSAFANNAFEDNDHMLSVPPLPAARPALQGQRPRRTESDEEHLSDSMPPRHSNVSLTSSIDEGQSCHPVNSADRKTQKVGLSSNRDSITTPSQRSTSSLQPAGGGAMAPLLVTSDARPDKLKKPSGTMHARRTSLQDAPDNFKEFTSPADKASGVQSAPVNKPNAPPTRPLLLGRKGSNSGLMLSNGRTRSRQSNQPTYASGTKPAPSVNQNDSRPTSRANEEGRPSSGTRIKAGQGLGSWAAPDLLLKSSIAAVEASKLAEAVREPSKEYRSRQRSTNETSVLDLADSSSANDDDDDADDSSGIVAPFAKQSTKALKLLGLDDGADPNLAKGGKSSVTTRTGSVSDGRRGGQVPGHDKIAADTGEAVTSLGTAGPNKRRENPALRQRKSNVRPRTTSSSSSSALRTSKSYMDFSHHHHSTASTAGPRREQQPLSTAAVFSAGPVEVGAQGNPLKKMRKAWRKGKGKDGADYRDSLEPLPMNISAPLGVPTPEKHIRRNGSGSTEVRGPLGTTSTAAAIDYPVVRTQAARSQRRQLADEAPTVSMDHRASLGNGSAAGPPTTRWALPSLDLQRRPLFNEGGPQVPSGSRTSAEDDAESLSWFTAAYS